MMTLYFFEQNPVFTDTEFKEFLLTNGTSNPNTQRELLAYHLNKQHIIRIRRGLYASVPPSFRGSIENVPVDPFLIIGRITVDSVIAYQSAFDFHGVSYSLHHQYLYLSTRLIRPFIFDHTKYICLPYPSELLAQSQGDFEVIIAERLGLKVRLTSLERTMVDVLHRPDYGGGWEEIWRSAEHIPILNLEKVIQYATLLNNATTISKLGFFLEQFKTQLNVEESDLRYLESKIPRGVHYLERRKRESGKFLPRWNLIVPEYILEKNWEEPNTSYPNFGCA